MFVILLSSVALALEDPVKEDSERFVIIIIVIVINVIAIVINVIIIVVILIFVVVQKPEVGPARLRLHCHLCN